MGANGFDRMLDD